MKKILPSDGSDATPAPLNEIWQIRLFYLAGLVVMAGLCAGLYATFQGHEETYRISRQAPWGIITAAYAYFASLGTGFCLVAVMSHAYGLSALAPVKNRAVYLCLVTLVAGAALLSFSMEHPWKMFVYNAISPNLTSNLWWLCTLIGVMGGAMFLEFSQITAGTTSRFRIGMVGAVAGVGASNNLGALFTAAFDPPIWHGAQLIVLYLAGTVVAGAAGIILCTVAATRLQRRKIDNALDQALQATATVLALMLAILLVVTAARFTAIFRGTSEEAKAAALLFVRGPLSVSFWGFEVLAGGIAPLLLLGVSRLKNAKVSAIAALLALVGLFVQRCDLLVAGQILPKIQGWQGLPQSSSHLPGIMEILVVVSGFGFWLFGFLAGEKYLTSTLMHEDRKSAFKASARPRS